MLSSEGCAFTTSISADYGNARYQFCLECNADSSGQVKFTVKEPDGIQGIQGRILASQGEIHFDEAVLAYPLLIDSLPSPLSAPWITLNALRSGYITSTARVNGNTIVTMRDRFEDKPLILEFQFNSNFEPVLCDISTEGRKYLTVQIENFQIQ